MTSPVFVKRYTDPARGVTTRAHHRWLADLDSGVRLPALHPGTGTHLVFERLSGRHATPADLGCAATALGALHGAAYATWLHGVALNTPLRIRGGVTLAAFTVPSRADALAQVGVDVTEAPTALYKDANIRNFLITPEATAMVDFDDLTLAPFGYDLAKLLVTAAMTHGRLPQGTPEAVLAAYTTAAVKAGGPPDSCSMTQLAAYTELHHLLTCRYLNRNGYQHPWPTVRPW